MHSDLQHCREKGPSMDKIASFAPPASGASPLAESDTREVDSAGALLRINDLGVSYGKGKSTKHIIQGLNFSVKRKEFICVVGPSGVGKTTLIRCIAGLQRPTLGEVELQGKPVREPRDGVAFVSQDYSRSLMPWLKIRDNVLLPLRGKKLSKADMRERCEYALAAVGLENAHANYPWQLSGGMQQRVSMARALAYKPDLLIMDEPFASLDAQTRAELEDLVLQLQHSTGLTTVLITHDIDTSIYMADRVLVLGGHPASLIDTVHTELGSDRDQISTKSSQKFLEGRNRVLRGIKEAQGMTATNKTKI